MGNRRVVVTGLGVVSPLGSHLPEFWENVTAGMSGAGPITRFDPTLSNTKTKFACEVRNFDVTEYIDRKEARKLDACAQFSVGAGVQAVNDSGLDLKSENLDRIGVIMGIGIGGCQSFQSGLTSVNQQKESGQEPKLTPFFIPQIIGSMTAGYLSIKFGFHGPGYVTSAACASGTNALIDAVNMIRLGKADVMLTGGSEAPLIDSGIAGFNAMHALSTRNDSPATASRPMSGSRDGFVIAEGAACLVLEEYSHAVSRNAHIYAEVAGWGLSSDAFHITAPDPEGAGAIKVMQNALDDAGMRPEDIDYINMHGTSTPLGDVAECKAIRSVFGEHVYDMNLSATKSMTGHLLGGAGAIEGVISVMSVMNDIVPPTINHEDGDNDEQIDYRMNFTFNKAQKRTVRAALSNTFGFGGHNACIIFKKPE
ncbi:MAG: beta-ketoacyl-ACP synthase II [Bacteroidaceae bacterium]|nr:beta-ketoacyl-ACP synthase II [Bacteroidaceae bacterium]